MREDISDKLQKNYWNSLSGEYFSITSIDRSDFHYGPQIPGEKDLKLLNFLKPGMSALELGCGGAQNSIWLWKRGVSCTAVDISEEQIAHACALAEQAGASVDFHIAGIEDFLASAKPEAYDFVHSSHAFEFIKNPASAILLTSRTLKPGGYVMISSVHPLFNGDWISVEYTNDDGACISEDGQFIRNYFEPPDDIRDDDNGHAVSRAYPVSMWFDWFSEAGLRVCAVKEPRAVKKAPYTSDGWANHDGQLDAIPSTVIFLAAKLP